MLNESYQNLLKVVNGRHCERRGLRGFTVDHLATWLEQHSHPFHDNRFAGKNLILHPSNSILSQMYYVKKRATTAEK